MTVLDLDDVYCVCPIPNWWYVLYVCQMSWCRKCMTVLVLDDVYCACPDAGNVCLSWFQMTCTVHVLMQEIYNCPGSRRRVLCMSWCRKCMTVLVPGDVYCACPNAGNVWLSWIQTTCTGHVLSSQLVVCPTCVCQMSWRRKYATVLD